MNATTRGLNRLASALAKAAGEGFSVKVFPKTNIIHLTKDNTLALIEGNPTPLLPEGSFLPFVRYFRRQDEITALAGPVVSTGDEAELEDFVQQAVAILRYI